MHNVPSSVLVGAAVLGVSPALQQSVFLYGSWSGIRGEAPPQTYPLTVGGKTEPCEGRGTQVRGIGSKHGIPTVQQPIYKSLLNVTRYS